MTASNITPAYDHIVVVVEENHTLNEIIGSPQAPYLNLLANGGAVLTNYHAVTHPSEPNYFAMYAGSTFGVADDGNYNEPDSTLATVLQSIMTERAISFDTTRRPTAPRSGKS